MTTAQRVDTAVMETDSGTSANARYEITFEATPPGQHDTRISPTASGAGSPINEATDHPIKGMTVY
jgi:hypothetical protein